MQVDLLFEINRRLKDSVKCIPLELGLWGRVEAVEHLPPLQTVHNNLDEDTVKEKYLEAIEDLQIKDFDFSLKKFIEVIRENRNYDNDGARKACLTIFKYIGEDNEITLANRRDFGSALYI